MRQWFLQTVDDGSYCARTNAVPVTEQPLKPEYELEVLVSS
jgi:hypothetical protein